jgi:hypothetical protein
MCRRAYRTVSRNKFNERVDDVFVIKDPLLSSLGYTATTRAGDGNYKIYIGTSCADFWKSPGTVLEEYAHIQLQWKKGRMDALSYAILFAIYGYDHHPDENEAKRYRDKYWNQLNDCFRHCRDKC